MHKKTTRKGTLEFSMEKRKRLANQKYLSLKFTDDFLFCKILQGHPEIAKELIELILRRRVRKVVIRKQESIELTADGRGIRLDVYVEEEQDTIYDLEMQTTRDPELPKRSRYYQGMIDLNSINRGARFRELRTTYVIFICLKDPFGYGNHIYTFENRCNEVPELVLGDEAYKIVLNASGTKDDVSENLLDFFELLKTGKGKTELSRKIQKEVQRAKTHKEWRSEYMTLYMRDEQMRDEGRAEGRTEGRTEGEERLAKLIRFLLAAGRTEDAQKAVESEGARKEFYDEFGIE